MCSAEADGHTDWRGGGRGGGRDAAPNHTAADYPTRRELFYRCTSIMLSMTSRGVGDTSLSSLINGKVSSNCSSPAPDSSRLQPAAAAARQWTDTATVHTQPHRHSTRLIYWLTIEISFPLCIPYDSYIYEMNTKTDFQMCSEPILGTRRNDTN